MATRRHQRGPRSREPQLPPNDFRSLSVCPTPQEILSTEKPFLRRNITRGPYTGVDHYLDVQFRLMREDFLRPLREGIAAYRENEASRNGHTLLEARADTSTLRLYTNVWLREVTFSREELCVSVTLDPKQDNHKNNEKAFMNGSLVLFSRDGFDTMIRATVMDSQWSEKNKTWTRILQVKLINDEDLLAINSRVYYTMAESVAFFEPYSHVLSALQTMVLEEYPMCQYITGEANTTQPPLYAANTYVYTADGSVVRASNARDWPTAATLGLNPSQYEAYKGALGREFAIIQGPPGTGKTYLGAKVAQALINGAADSMSPLLVVCATNHALDQFLENLLQFTSNLVRVGNQSTSNKLQPYLLSEQKKHASYREMNSGLASTARQTSTRMETLHEKICTLLPDRRALVLIAEFNRQAVMLKACRQAMVLNVLCDAKVVGMTTSAAARLRPLLDQLQPRTMIVEEAAEVLEGHIVASLPTYCQHVILIGDHQQLRPITSSNDLTRDYQMDISLFERMLNNRVPCVTLNVQHRMRPEVARLVSPVIYPELMNHASVNNRDNVRGIHKSVFFITHDQREQVTAGKSQSNMHEVTLLIALCRYLLLQKYEAKKITIIAMYGAQVACLEAERGKFPEELKDVIISTVDGYQGEENDIVLLSLVRSNLEAKIGFLRTVNRVCVALSRARNGLYIVGNMENLTRENSNSLWCRINAVLKKHQSVGTQLQLHCTQHDNTIHVSGADDFNFDKVTTTKCPLKCPVIIPVKCPVTEYSGKKEKIIEKEPPSESIWEFVFMVGVVCGVVWWISRSQRTQPVRLTNMEAMAKLFKKGTTMF